MYFAFKGEFKGGNMENNLENKKCRDKIIELVEKIENLAILKLIYGLVRSGYAEEKAGSE